MSISAACAVAMAHRNHFIRLYQHNKSSASKVKIRLTINCLERILELAHANKTKESITSQKLGFYDFWEIGNSVPNKRKSAIRPLFNRPERFSSAFDKATFILMTRVSLFLLSLQSETG